MNYLFSSHIYVVELNNQLQVKVMRYYSGNAWRFVKVFKVLITGEYSERN